MDMTIIPLSLTLPVLVIASAPDVLPGDVDQCFFVGHSSITKQDAAGVWLGPTSDGIYTGPFDPISGWQQGKNLGGIRMRLVRE